MVRILFFRWWAIELRGRFQSFGKQIRFFPLLEAKGRPVSAASKGALNSSAGQSICWSKQSQYCLPGVRTEQPPIMKMHFEHH